MLLKTWYLHSNCTLLRSYLYSDCIFTCRCLNCFVVYTSYGIGAYLPKQTSMNGWWEDIMVKGRGTYDHIKAKQCLPFPHQRNFCIEGSLTGPYMLLIILVVNTGLWSGILVMNIINWCTNEEMRCCRGVLGSGRRACLLLVTGKWVSMQFKLPPHSSMLWTSLSLSLSLSPLHFYMTPFLHIYTLHPCMLYSCVLLFMVTLLTSFAHDVIVYHASHTCTLYCSL